MIICEQKPMDGVVVLRSVYDEDINSFETYNYEELKKYGIVEKFVQEDQSLSKKGVLRGLHFQKKHAQAQIVRVLKGKVFDVVVDIRKDSITFGKWFGIELSDEVCRMVYMSDSFAHGFYVMSDEAVLHYRCSQYYHPEDESGVIYNDPYLDIKWPIEDYRVLEISKKDLGYPRICEL